MNIQIRTFAQVKRLASWGRLIAAVRGSRSPYWFDNSDSIWHQSRYIDLPRVTRGEEPRTYWVESVANGEGTRGFYVYCFDGESVERVTPWDEPHASAEIALGSVAFLAAV